MTTDTLTVLLAGTEIGALKQNRQGRLTFVYTDAWRMAPQAMPLSLSMPLTAAEHGNDVIEAYLWGLLPDNEQTIRRWAREFHVSARNVFALISEVGEDCAGAAQFIRHQRLDEITSNAPAVIDWLDEQDIAERLRILRTDQSAWRRPDDVGQFSLAGAQPKTALLFQDGRWGIPAGRTPTTHILKPPTDEFDGHAENEHLSLVLARALGMPVASSEVRTFGDQVAIVVERFDRAVTASLAAAASAESESWAAEAAASSATDPAAAASAAANATAAAAQASVLADLAKVQPILRLHQEDLCQAFGLMPTIKYQNEAGPSPRDIVEMLRSNSSRPQEDVETFVDALLYNWLIAGTDAHAKNHAILHGGGGRVRLAPLYDLASALPYDALDPLHIKLAMKIGREYRIRDIGPRQWRQLAKDLRLSPEQIVLRGIEMADAMLQQIPQIIAKACDEGLHHPIVAQLEQDLSRRAEACARDLRRDL